MRWKLLAALDVGFSTLAVLAAVAFGNNLIAERVPALHDNATWLSKLAMDALTAPDAIADWALGFAPGVTPLLLVLLLLGGEASLILFTPLVAGLVAFAGTQEFKLNFPEAYARVSRQRSKIWPLKRQMLRRTLRRLLLMCLLAFGIGVISAAIAWGVAALININSGGIIQSIAVIVGVLVLLVAAAVASEVLPAAAEDDKSEAFREGFTQMPK